MVAGNATLVAGNATLVASNATLVAGNATLVAGNATLVAGNATLVAGNATLVAGNATLVAGKKILEKSLQKKIAGAILIIYTRQRERKGEKNMATDYIPRKIADYRRFSDHFVQVISQKAAAWGIPDTAKTKLTGGHSEWTQAQDEADNPETRTSIVIEKARRLRKEDTANIRWIVNTFINPNPSGIITMEDRLDLELHIQDKTPSRHPAPVSRPDTEVTPSGKFRHTVSALNSATNKKEKPADAYGVRYAWQLDGIAPASPADLPKSKFSRKTQEHFSWDPSAQSKPVHFATCYENAKGDQGPWSAVVSTIVP